MRYNALVLLAQACFCQYTSWGAAAVVLEEQWYCACVCAFLFCSGRNTDEMHGHHRGQNR